MTACKMAEIIFHLFTTCEVTSGVRDLILNSLAQYKKTPMYWDASSKKLPNVHSTLGKPKEQGKAKWIAVFSNLEREKGDINSIT